jgi:uncharacterized protein YjiS (DUF1127 family)
MSGDATSARRPRPLPAAQARTSAPRPATPRGRNEKRASALLWLAATWWERASFRAQLRADLASRADFLRDIGIDAVEAQAEAARFFWEAISLTARR